MTGALLRTGTLTAFEPLGALGNPVYLAASQIRAAIGRRLGTDAADVLAIPHRNQDGDTVDWYAPRLGPVVPWSAATQEERAQAKEQLLGIQGRIEALGQTMQSEDAGERQVFGRLLEHVTRFPDDAHVYLVDGRPVITFWGFRHQNAPVDSNPLLNLDVAPQEPAPAEERRRPSWWWMMPLLLLLALLLVWLLRGCEEAPAPSAPAVEPEPVSSPMAPIAPGEQIPPQEEPAIENPDEPALAEDPERPDLLVRDGETRIIESDRVSSDNATVLDEAVAVDQLQGEATGDLAPTGETETSEAFDVPGEASEIDATTTDTPEVPASDGEAEPLPLDPVESEPETESLQGDATEEMPTTGETAGPPLEEPPPEQPPEQQVDQPPGAAEDGEGGPAPEKSPDAGTPDATQPPQPPEPIATDEAAQQGATLPPDAPANGSKGDGPASEPGNGAESLKLPPGAVSRGSTQFLNGGWRTSTSLQDPRTALPVDMEYQLKDGAGRLSLKRSDGSVCSGQVKAVIEDGKLVVQNARDIRCPDGTNFGRPRLECVPGKDGRADCSGRYETGEVFSVDIKKDDKSVTSQ